MRCVFLPIGLFATSAIGQSLTIDTPSSAVVCQPLNISWSGGTPPYFLRVLPGDQPNASPLIDLGEEAETLYVWVVNVTSSTSVMLQLRDSTGAVAMSAPFTIQAGDTHCITQYDTGTSQAATHTSNTSRSPSGASSLVATSSNTNKMPLGAIVVAAAGGALLLATIGFCFWRRRLFRSSSVFIEESGKSNRMGPQMFQAEPYTLSTADLALLPQDSIHIPFSASNDLPSHYQVSPFSSTQTTFPSLSRTNHSTMSLAASELPVAAHVSASQIEIPLPIPNNDQTYNHIIPFPLTQTAYPPLSKHRPRTAPSASVRSPSTCASMSTAEKPPMVRPGTSPGALPNVISSPGPVHIMSGRSVPTAAAIPVLPAVNPARFADKVALKQSQDGFPQMPLAQRAKEIYGMIAQLEIDTAAAGLMDRESARVFELQRQVEYLKRENARLAGLSPPAYAQ